MVHKLSRISNCHFPEGCRDIKMRKIIRNNNTKDKILIGCILREKKK